MFRGDVIRGTEMDRALEFLNRWIARPVAIVTAIGTIFGFLFVAIDLLLNSSITIDGAALPLPEISLPEIAPADVHLVLPGFDALFTSESQYLLLIVPTIFVILLCIALGRIGDDDLYRTLIVIIPLAFSLFAGALAASYKNEFGVWEIITELRGQRFASNLELQGHQHFLLTAILCSALAAVTAWLVAHTQFESRYGFWGGGILSFLMLFIVPAAGLCAAFPSLHTLGPERPTTSSVLACTPAISRQASEATISPVIQRVQGHEAIVRLRELGCYQRSADGANVTYAFGYQVDGLDRCEIVRVNARRTRNGLTTTDIQALTTFDGPDCRRFVQRQRDALARHASPTVIAQFFTPPGASDPSVLIPNR